MSNLRIEEGTQVGISSRNDILTVVSIDDGRYTVIGDCGMPFFVSGTDIVMVMNGEIKLERDL